MRHHPGPTISTGCASHRFKASDAFSSLCGSDHQPLTPSNHRYHTAQAFPADRFHDFSVSLADELFRTPQQNRDRAARLMLVPGLSRLSSPVGQPLPGPYLAFGRLKRLPVSACAASSRCCSSGVAVAVGIVEQPLFVALLCLPAAPLGFPAWSSPRPAPVAKPRLRRMVIEASIHRRTTARWCEGWLTHIANVAAASV